MICEKNDPYAILEVSYSASQQEIQRAFQEKMHATKGAQEIVTAYGLLRDKESRQRFFWEHIWGMFYEPQEGAIHSDVDLEKLIQELAFLTEWELGDDTCLKMNK